MRAMHAALAALALAAAAGGGYAVGRGGPPLAPPIAPAAEPESLYVAAREAMAAGRPRLAAALFRRLWRDFPRSPRAPDAPYWEALAAQRAGDSVSLRRAVQALDVQRTRFPSASTRNEADALAARIRARVDTTRIAPPPPAASVCRENGDPDAALARLARIQDDDPAAAAKALRAIIAHPACPGALRRQAVMLFAQRPDADRRDLLLSVAREDADAPVRAEAAFWLGGFPAPAVLPVLDSVARHGSPEVRENAIAAVAQLHTPESRQMLARLLRDPAVPLADKEAALEAVMGFDPGPEDAAQLRELYPTLHPRLRTLAIQALGHVQDARNAEWLLALALDPATPAHAAGEAMYWSSRAGIPAERLIALYPRLTERTRRERLLHAMTEEPGPAAEALLRQAAKSDPDPRVRESAGIWLRERLGREP